MARIYHHIMLGVITDIPSISWTFLLFPWYVTTLIESVPLHLFISISLDEHSSRVPVVVVVVVEAVHVGVLWQLVSQGSDQILVAVYASLFDLLAPLQIYPALVHCCLCIHVLTSVCSVRKYSSTVSSSCFLSWNTNLS